MTASNDQVQTTDSTRCSAPSLENDGISNSQFSHHDPLGSIENGQQSRETDSSTTASRGSGAFTPPPTFHASNPHHVQAEDEDWFEDKIGKPSRDALHHFFYPPLRGQDAQTSPPSRLHRGHETFEGSSSHHTAADENDPRDDVLHADDPLPTVVQQEFNDHFEEQQVQDKQFVERFWTAYDDIIILALLTQVGILFRLATATWFAVFDNVFRNDSALFVNLPLNCLSCFFLGMLGSGERLMEIIVTRFSPPRLQQALQQQLNDDAAADDDEDSDDSDVVVLRSPNNGSNRDGGSTTTPNSTASSSANGTGVLRRRNITAAARRQKRDRYFHSWEPPLHLNDDLRDVQLLALERRIRQSKCLLLFPVRKEDVDVMEHYFHDGYKRREDEEAFDLALQEDDDGDADGPVTLLKTPRQRLRLLSMSPLSPPTPLRQRQQQEPLQIEDDRDGSDHVDEMQLESADVASPMESNGAPVDNFPPNDLNQMVHDVQANVTENISRLKRVNLADGWDLGTTPEAMSDDLMLGLRDGFCGALSSFSSWNSAMVNLLKAGQIGQSFVGYMLGLQLPIVAYRFGQHVTVYIFIWRCRRETKRDERRGYGIRVATNEHSDRDDTEIAEENDETGTDYTRRKDATKRELPSIRAVATAIFIMSLVTQCTSLSFFSETENREIALSLLFSPLGVLARWRLSKLNTWRPSFPLGTFTANILACSLSGSLGTLLAGNPGPRERIVLQSFINGFGGTLSSLANFVVEILAGVDPVLLRFDGIVYAVVSIFCALVVGIVFSTSVDWADQTGTKQP